MAPSPGWEFGPGRELSPDGHGQESRLHPERVLPAVLADHRAARTRRPSPAEGANRADDVADGVRPGLGAAPFPGVRDAGTPAEAKPSAATAQDGRLPGCRATLKADASGAHSGGAVTVTVVGTTVTVTARFLWVIHRRAHELEPAGTLPQVRQQVPRLLGSPAPSGCAVTSLRWRR